MKNYMSLSLVEQFLFVEKEIDVLEEQLRDVDFIVGVSRGGLVFAAMIAAAINKPLVAVYVNKTKNYEISCDHFEWISCKKICIIDDIIRSGKTMQDIVDYFHKRGKGLANIKIFVLARQSTTKELLLNTGLKIIKAGVFPHILKEGDEVLFPWDKEE
jgi:adenine/guanine phosphoribosyltransferase-like PRPP-binding protein